MDQRVNTVLTSYGGPLSRILVRYIWQREGRKQNTNCVLTISAETAIHFRPYRQTTPCIQTQQIIALYELKPRTPSLFAFLPPFLTTFLSIILSFSLSLSLSLPPTLSGSIFFKLVTEY